MTGTSSASTVPVAHDSACTGLVVVNYGSHALLRRTLAAHHLPWTQVVVVDNFHSDAERAALSDLAAEHGWDVVALPDNPGFGVGVNAGVARARALGCDTVVILNPDAVATPEAISALRAMVDADPGALVTPWLTNSAGEVEFSGARMYLRDGRIRSLRHGQERTDLPRRLQRSDSVAWLTGACLALRCELFERIGGFAVEYFLYWEDVDLSYRAARAGARLVVASDVRVVHDEGGTQGAREGRAKSRLYYYYNTRNRLVFASRHLGRAQLVRWILVTPAVSWEILMRGGLRQLLASRDPLRAVVSGSLRGIAIAVGALWRRHPRRPG